MKFPALQVATALALVLGASAAQAQGEQKHEEGKAPPAHKAAPKPRTEKAKPDKAHPDKAAVEKELREKAARKKLEDKQKAVEAAKHQKGTGDTTANGKKVHLSEHQRDSVHEALLKEKGLHRARNVKVKPTAGTRIPRDIRIYVLPVAILVIVPEYRSYRYIVIDDAFCIVEPSTYEVVDVITTSGQTAAHARLAAAPTAAPALILSDEERTVVLGSVDAQSESTLGLGFLTVGADVPRTIELKGFPEAVLEKVSKLKDYKYFSAEGRIAIVDPKHAKVQMVLEPRR